MSAGPRAPLRAALLDVDGTLVASNDAHARSWVEAAREFGHEVQYEEVRRLIGMGGDKLLPRITGLDADSAAGKRLTQHRMELFRRDYLPTLEPLPGARALVERLLREGLTVVAASSARSRELGALLERAGVDDLIESRTSSSDVEESKPDPDIVSAALREAGCGRDEAVMVGDTPYDVEACRRAGVRIVAVRSGGWDDEALRGAAAIYDHPADLLAHWDESPFAARRARDG